MSIGRVVAGLDLGTTKITTIIAEVDEHDNVDVIGVGQTVSQGIERGMVVNLEQTVQSIRHSAEEAQHMAGTEIESVYAGIAGDHIRGINSHAAVAVGRSANEITQDDVVRVVEHAKTINIPQDLTIIHVIPQEFAVDTQRHVRDPIGLAGSRLEGEVHIVTGAATAVQNVQRAVERAGLQVADVVLQPLASSMAVLTPDEQELGVAVLDVGGGTTDMAVFYRRSIRHTAIVALGGTNVTNDIAIGLRTPMDEAETLKKEHGCAMIDMVPEDREIVPRAGLGGRAPVAVRLHYLTEIIESRMEEIFEYSWREIERTEFAGKLASGVVLTGGGAMIKGATELAQRVFGVPVKLGVPMGVGGLVEKVSHFDERNRRRPRPVRRQPSSPDAFPYGRTLSSEPSEKPEGRLSGIYGWFRDFFTG